MDPMEPTGPEQQASMLMLQNMMLLARQLKLPISYKAHERKQQQDAAGSGSGRPGSRTFTVVVHVRGDHAFKKYLQSCTPSDLLLFRGLLLQVETTPDAARLLRARVQQAFLPKFENEGQDAAIADAIVEGAGAAPGRPMVVTIKHSGSLVTLSADGGWAAKNSIANDFTAGGAALLRTHYERLERGDAQRASQRLDQLFFAMRARHLTFSFEMVTACHGHHGQLPSGEYLVCTSAHSLDPATHAPAFLPWIPFLELCVELGLPLNDTWVLGGRPMAAAGRAALDELATRGGPTAGALRALGALVEEAEKGGAEGCVGVHLPGTYPHDQWQGSRIEGFVVAQGQPLDAEAVARLRRLAEAMRAQSLELAGLPPRLRRPYQDAVALARSAGQAKDAEALRAHLQGKVAEWTPLAAVPHVSVGADTRQRIEQLLAEQRVPLPDGAAALPLPGASGRVVWSRAAVAALGSAALQGMLQQQAATAEAGGEVGTARTAALRQAAAEVAMADDPVPDALLVKAFRALAGEPDLGTTLRYKKKMSLYRLPAAAGSGAAGDGSSGDGVVGYCLMTFVIRNGLAALKQGLPTYLAYVENLARRSWKLPEHQAAQVLHFARCWAAWLAARGGPAAVDESAYLDSAEPFAAEFLAAGGTVSASGRPADAFQGVLVCVDTPKALTDALARALAPALRAGSSELQGLAFGRPLVAGGTLLWLEPGSQAPKLMRGFLEAAAPYVWVLAAKPEAPPGADDDTPAAKRQRGMAQGKLSMVTNPLGAERAATRVKSVTLPEASYGAADGVAGGAAAVGAADGAADGGAPGSVGAGYEGLVSEVVGWLGRGNPLPPADPAVVACFMGIPGVGKSALTQGLSVVVQGREVQLTTKVLNSDIMKRTLKNYQPARYWCEVANAADSCQGGGAAVLVVADKNLVPSPPGNIARSLEPLKGSGVASVAIVPVCRGATSAASRPELYAGLQDLPFPLELVALCMMRTLQRKKHEGNLDGSQSKEAASVVAMFAAFYRHKTLGGLLEGLAAQFTRVVELEVMEGDGDGALPLELLAHMAAGLKEVSERSRPPLPAEWESRARELLLQPANVAALEALQLPLPDVRATLERELGAALEGVTASPPAGAGDVLAPAPSLATAVAGLGVSGGGDVTATAAPGAAGSAVPEPARLAYIAVAGFDGEAVRRAVAACLPAELAAKLRKGPLHVTLWHRNDPVLGPDQELKQQLLALAGTPVQLQLDSVLVSPEVIAAEVVLLSDEEALHVKPFHHVTLMVAPGQSAKDANLLPARLEAGEEGVAKHALVAVAGAAAGAGGESLDAEGEQGGLVITGVVVAVEDPPAGAGGNGRGAGVGGGLL